MAAAAPRLIAIVGPTAAGKSEAAVALALALTAGGEIVSCDSLQVYRGLDIGSAKPSPVERRGIAHHLLDVVDASEAFSAAAWVSLAKAAIAGIVERRRVPIVVGGTGLYLRALLHGLFEGPSRDEALRRRLEGIAKRHGRERLHRLLRGIDPEAARRIAPADLVRVTRAIEVYSATRKPLSAHFGATQPGLPGYLVGLFGLSPARQGLRERVEARTAAMLEGGLVEEVRALLHAGLAPEARPLRAIGYRQALAVVHGEMDLRAAQRAIVTETMQYAKRQRTWFRHQAEVTWFEDSASLCAAAQAWLRAPE